MINPLIAITRKQAILFASFLVIYEFLTYIANDMIMPGMLRVVQDFHADESRIASSLTAYILGGASLQLLLGPLSDRFGRRPLMLIGCGFFTVFTLLLPFAQTINQFLMGRFFEGTGLCYINVLGYALLQEIFSDQDAIRVVAIMANVSILAPLLGPLAGSVFLQYVSWHVIFYVIGAGSLWVFWGLWRYMPETIGHLRDGKVIKVSAISVPAILRNYQSLLVNSKFLLGTFAYALSGIPCVVWIALSPVILVSKAHLSLITYGLWQMPIFGAFIFANLCLSYFSGRYSLMRLSLIGSLIVFLGLVVFSFFPYYPIAQPLSLMPGLICYSLGYGIAATPLYRFILFSTSVSTGTSSALISMITMGTLAVGVELGNVFFAVGGLRSIAMYLGCLAVLYIFCVFLCFFLRETAQKSGDAPC